MSSIASNLIQNASSISAGIAANYSCELFPDYINIKQLIVLIEDTQPPIGDSLSGFGEVLEELWNSCPSEDRNGFIGSLAKLALSKPFLEGQQRISKKYAFLSKHFISIAHSVISSLGDNTPTIELIRLLMAIERGGRSASFFKELKPSLDELVQASPKVKIALFWADVAEARENVEDAKYSWQFYPPGSQLWILDFRDLSWLYQDLQRKLLIDEKYIALGVIVSILRAEQMLEKEKERLYQCVQNHPILVETLDNYLKPYDIPEWEQKFRLDEIQNKKKQCEKDANTKESWLKFRNELIADPTQLSIPAERLRNIELLTEWLRLETDQGETKAARQWYLIKTAFNEAVAEAYQCAMKAHWRSTKPERPEHQGNEITTKWATIYAYAGIGIEADENESWASRLTPEEAERATEHGCKSEQDYPDWLDALLEAHPSVVVPIIVEAFHFEWKSSHNGARAFLYYYRHSKVPLHTDIASEFFEIMIRIQPATPDLMEYGLRIFYRMELSRTQKSQLKRQAITQFEYFLECDNIKFATCYLVLLFQADPQVASKKMSDWIEEAPVDKQVELAIEIIGRIFNPDDCWLVARSIKNAPIQILKNLISLAYRFIRPVDDISHGGIFTPDSRDHAETGRSELFSILHNSIGIDAYQAMIELANTPEIGERKHRFQQLARGMAERDAEFQPWTENDMLTFESRYTAPINNGDALYQCVLNVLDDIQQSLEYDDASSKRLLSKLAQIKQDDEESVQNWLAEQLKLRANDRYHVHREPEVANQNKPDIIISGAGGLFEIAIEVKQADSWSPNQLKEALVRVLKVLVINFLADLALNLSLRSYAIGNI